MEKVVRAIERKKAVRMVTQELEGRPWNKREAMRDV